MLLGLQVLFSQRDMKVQCSRTLADMTDPLSGKRVAAVRSRGGARAREQGGVEVGV